MCEEWDSSNWNEKEMEKTSHITQTILSQSKERWKRCLIKGQDQEPALERAPDFLASGNGKERWEE